MANIKHSTFRDGDRFGFWVLVAIAAPYRNGQTRWICRCDCGTEGIKLLGTLISGESKSCGCRRAAVARDAHTRHGRWKTSEYLTWGAMKARCYNPNNKRYENYGGRGIRVCERWRDSFAAFYEDMGSRPSPKHSIDRIDNDGDYEPSNCRWATASEQLRHTTRNKHITYKGETLCVTDWATRLNLPPKRLRSRLSRGWTVEGALETPLRGVRC